MKFKLLNTFMVLFIFASIQIIGQTQFVKHINNPIYSSSSYWDSYTVNSCIVYEDQKYNMYYTAKVKEVRNNSLYMYLGYARSDDGMKWQKFNDKPILSFEEKWERNGFLDAMVIVVNSVWHMWYTCPADVQISNTYLGYATSSDGIKWEKRVDRLNLIKSKLGWDSGGIFPLSVIHDGSKFIMYYKAYSVANKNEVNKKYAIGIAESTDGITWHKNKVNNPIIEFRDARSLNYKLGNVSVIYNKDNTDQPYQMWYIGSNDVVDKNQYVFHATSRNGRTWSKSTKPIISSKEDNWAQLGFCDVEIVKVGKNYKMWLNGIAGNSKTGSVVGYAEDFTNAIHCKCLECGCRFNTCGGAPEDFKTWVCNPSSEKVYVWGRIDCAAGSESQLHNMYKLDGEGCYEIAGRVHCSGEKFYNFSSFVTSDPSGENVIFDSKYFHVDKFTTVPKPKIEIVDLEEHLKADYRARLKMTNISATTSIPNPKVKVTSANGLIDLITLEKISFYNIKAETSEYSTNYIYFDVKGSDTYIDVDFDIYSDEVLYWSDSLRGIQTDIANLSTQLPGEFSLAQNYPNPFNPSTTIKYEIPSVASDFSLSNVTLKVYDILGREVATLVNKQQKAGYYEVNWNAVNNSSGVYFYKILAGDFVETKKMLLLR